VGLLDLFILSSKEDEDDERRAPPRSPTTTAVILINTNYIPVNLCLFLHSRHNVQRGKSGEEEEMHGSNLMKSIYSSTPFTNIFFQRERNRVSANPPQPATFLLRENKITTAGDETFPFLSAPLKPDDDDHAAGKQAQRSKI